MPSKTCPCILSLACLAGRLKTRFEAYTFQCPQCHLTVICVEVKNNTWVDVYVPCPGDYKILNKCLLCDCPSPVPRSTDFDLTTEEGVASFRKELAKCLVKPVPAS